MTTYQISADELRKILIGVELPTPDDVYTAGFAVNNEQLGNPATLRYNHSGFSFGFAQLERFRFSCALGIRGEVYNST